MRIIVYEDYLRLSLEVAKIVKKEVNKNEKTVLALPSGKTPVGLYKELIKMYEQKKVDFSNVTTFALDEYFGLNEISDFSFAHFIRTHFLNHVNVLPKNAFFPISDKKNIDKVCAIYEKEIEKRGGIDLAILGIGVNGHIAFNEPGSSQDSKTRLVELSPETIEYNRKTFENKKDIPLYGVTMGISTILKARKIILMANGKEKAKILKKAFTGQFEGHIPASFLKQHKNLLICIDKSARFLY